ncbi:hypothetical protein Nmel_004528 [Mimus melanotis]
MSGVAPAEQSRPPRTAGRPGKRGPRGCPVFRGLVVTRRARVHGRSWARCRGKGSGRGRGARSSGGTGCAGQRSSAGLGTRMQHRCTYRFSVSPPPPACPSSSSFVCVRVDPLSPRGC